MQIENEEMCDSLGGERGFPIEKNARKKRKGLQ